MFCALPTLTGTREYMLPRYACGAAELMAPADRASVLEAHSLSPTSRPGEAVHFPARLHSSGAV